MSCPLCDAPGGTLLWQDAFCRVVLADEPDYPGFLRVIVNAHVKEMSDLPAAGQHALMRVVFAAEAALREVMQPDKINLASLGNAREAARYAPFRPARRGKTAGNHPQPAACPRSGNGMTLPPSGAPGC
ncbi:MAG: hypothetical protein B7X93_02680 [Hydrogenophilales bacterium 17-61-9]|nr:MAG: hypothetical protein B7X93_02680 [Hydrogenophilales bacterium 17-61-9]